MEIIHSQLFCKGLPEGSFIRYGRSHHWINCGSRTLGADYACLPRVPGTLCPAVMTAPAATLIAYCKEKKGKIVECGACGQDYGCELN